jgi:predicted phage tail protein
MKKMTQTNIQGAGALFAPKPKGQATEAEDTGISTSRLVVTEVLSHGDIEGLVGGKRGIYINKTPLQNANGSYNFQKVLYNFRRGTQNQSELPDYASETAVETSMGQQVKKSTGTVTRFIYNDNLDAIKVRFGVVLYKVSAGVRDSYDLQFKIETKNGSDPWRLKTTKTIQGKFSSEVEFEYEFPAVNYGGQVDTFGIRVTVISDDQDNAQDKFRQLNWKSYTELIKDKLNYSNTSVICFQFPGEIFTSEPERAYRLNGKIVKIPSNCTVNSNGSLSFSGTWDGTLYKPTKACSDPAWQLYYLMTDSVAGMGKRIKPHHIDLPSLYACSVYNNQGVPNGNGGYEPRFLCNVLLQGKQKATEVLDAFCSAFHAKHYWAGGKIRFWQDRPGPVVRQFTQSDIGEGNFTRSSTDLRSRFNQVLVTWNNPKKFYEREVEPVDDADGIERYQCINETETAAFGCFRRSHAIREGLWTLYGALKQTKIITFPVRAIACDVLPGDVFAVADEKQAKIRYGGLIASAPNNFTVELDSPVSLVGGGFTLSVTLPNGVRETRPLNANMVPGNYTTLFVQTPFSQVPNPESNWEVETNLVKSELFRVLSISEDSDPDKYEITGVEYDAGKWDEIELGIVAADLPTRLNIPITVSQPRSVMATSRSVGNGNVLFATFLPALGVDGKPDPTITSYQTEWSRDGYVWQETRTVPVGVYEVIYEGIQTGNYTVRVASVDLNGRVSEWVNSFSTAISVSSLYHPDTVDYLQRVIDVSGTAIPEIQAKALDNFVKGCYISGMRQFIDECYPFLGDSSGTGNNIDAARVKLWYFAGSPSSLILPTNPLDHPLYDNSVGISFSLVGAREYLNTGMVPSNHMVSATGNIAAYFAIGVAPSTRVAVGAQNAAGVRSALYGNYSDSRIYFLNGGNDSSVNPLYGGSVNGSIGGLIIGSATDKNYSVVSKNGFTLGEKTIDTANVTMPNVPIFVGAMNLNGTPSSFSVDPIGFVGIGRRGIPINAHGTYWNLVSALMGSIGRASWG